MQAFALDRWEINMKIGAQLYTVREFTQTSKDFANTIKKIAKIGYETVQISGISTSIPATEVAEICNAHNLEIIITHTHPDRIKNDTAALIKDHEIMNCNYIGIGAIPGSYGHTKQGFENFVKDFTPAATAIKKSGKKFMYHNHDFEFIKFDDKTALDYLSENLPNTGFTLDTYWVQMGGGDPAFWIEKLAGKVDVIHVKDLSIINGERRMSEVLEGNLNWDAIFETCKIAGVKYAMVEQDDCYGADPFKCMETSLQNLKKQGF